MPEISRFLGIAIRMFQLEGGTVAWPNGADLAPEYLAGRLVVQPAALNA